jgi:hypothetical protein
LLFGLLARSAFSIGTALATTFGFASAFALAQFH